jgi:signal transduction histidine kinase
VSMAMSFRARLVTLYSVMTSAALVGFSLLIFFAVSYQSYAALESSLAKRASHVIEQIDFADGKLVLPLSITRSSTIELRYEALIDENKNLSFKNPALGTNSISLNNVDLKLVKDKPRLYDSKLSNGVPVKLAVSRIKRVPSMAYFVSASPVEEVKKSMKSLGLTMLVGNVAFILLVIVIGNFFAGKALKPVTKITNMAKDISHGDLRKRVNLEGPRDELKELADTFDEMIARIEHLFEDQKLFFQDVSHDLRTPLTIIRGKIDVALMSKSATRDDYLKTLREVGEEAKIAGSMINDLLMAARGETTADDINKKIFPLDRMLIEVGARINSMAIQKGIEFNMEVPSDTVFVNGDEQKLAEAFLALGDNAVKYCSKGDKVFIGLSVDQDQAVINVKDNGPGISAADQPLVFQRFYRASDIDGKARGSGLGLAIAKRIIDAHEGTIELKQGTETGSVFEIKLSLTKQS